MVWDRLGRLLAAWELVDEDPFSVAGAGSEPCDLASTLEDAGGGQRDPVQPPALILDGEELVGAEQNRIVNVTILVPPHSEIVIRVSCIEAGRRGYSPPGFAAAGRVLNPEIHCRKAEAVTRNANAKRLRGAESQRKTTPTLA